MDTLREFIMEQMQLRHMSAREFARMVGVAHPSITTHLNEDGRIKEPSVDFLIKLGRATNTNPLLLLVMTYTDLKDDLEALVQLPVEGLLKAQQLENAPENIKEAVFLLLQTRADSR